jgi:hypothetical protein
MSKTAAQFASIAAAALLTLATVTGMNSIATSAYQTASADQLATTPMASAQVVTIVGRRST